MNGEKLMDWANGYYEEFAEQLHNGDLDLDDCTKLFKENKITPYQYNYAVEYLGTTEEI